MPASGGPLTSTVMTNPQGHTTTTTLEPAWGRALTVVDANNKTTTAAYDAIGRLIKLWQPGRGTNLTPNFEYGYTVQTGPASFITTKNLNPAGDQIASYEIVDGLARVRQSQALAPEANGGRVISDVTFDSRGLTATSSTLWNANAPAGALATFDPAAVPTQRRSVFDGARRVVSDQLWASGVQKWATTTVYDGDRTSVTPPDGGTPTPSIADAAGRVVELRQYTAAGTPTGQYQATTYSYDKGGRLAGMTDAAGNVWSNSYDLLGRQTSKVDPDRGTTTMAYDLAGQLLSTTDALGATMSYEYDDLGRATSLWQGPIDTGTKRTERVYDTIAKGQLTSSTRWVSGNPYTTTITGYNNAYQPLGTSVAFPSVEGALSTQGPWVTTSTYHVDGSVATQVLPSGGFLPAETITTSYDANGFMISSIGLDAYIASLSYYPWGDPYQTVSGSAGKQIRTTTTLDEASRRLTASTIETQNQTTPATWDERRTDAYRYDNAGNVTALLEKTGSTVTSA